MNNINGLSAKEFMEEFASRSKKIFNPAITEEGSSIYGIKVITDLPNTSDIITFLINGLSTDSSSKEILSTVGFVNVIEENKFCAANLAPCRIIKAGVGSESDKLILYFVHDNKNNSTQLIKTGVEVFIQQDNKNHAMSISYLTEEEYQSIESDLETITEGEVDSHFSFSINTGDEIIHITNGVDIIYPINYIENAKWADSLSSDINISINEGVSNPSITGSGLIDGNNLNGNIDLTVNTEPIIQEVLENLEIPVASSITLGGINVAENSYTFNNHKYPVKLENVNNKHYAYVDLSDISNEIPLDIHRYSDMSVATTEHPNLGEIVQYIGQTTQSYTRGYFYIRVRELIKGLLTPGTNWQFTNPVTGQSTLNNAVTEYNRLNDHLLTTNSILTFTPDTTTIVANTIDDTTVFNVVNGSFNNTLTYADIKDWGIELATLTYNDQYPELYTVILTLSYINESNPPVWVLKNVQPPVLIESALVYKGICTWAELEAKTLISKPGDFYTISDKANQEYFFNGIITSNWEDSWEYMGQVFTQYQADWTQNNSSAVDYIKNKPTIPAAQIQSDWNQTDNTLLDFIKNKPTIPVVPTNVSAFTNDAGYITSATNSASLQVSDASNGKINTSETTGNYLQFTGGTDKFTITDKDNQSFDVSISHTDPTVNNGTYSVKTKVGTTETTVSDFTANQYGTDDVTFILGSNVTLTPDDTNRTITIAATNTTYSAFGASGSSHSSGLVPDPGATSGSSKYLCEDGTWSTPVDSNTTYTFAEGSTDGTFNVTPSGGSTSSVTVHNVLKTSGGTMTGQVYYNESGTVTSAVSCTRKYNWLEINSDTTLSITMPNSLDGPCEVIYAIKNTHSTNSVTLTLPSTGHNMVGVGSFSIAAGKLAEVVFTFWSTSEVSFNGGVESPV